MSKRWKFRKANAAKLEKHYDVIDQFYGNIIRLLENELDKTKQQIKTKEEKP